MLDHLKKILVLGAFSASIAIGGWLLTDYSYRPGTTNEVIVDLSEDEQTPKLISDYLDESPTLILFVHPQCPCTMSTARNLQRIQSRQTRKPQIIVYAFCPSDKTDSWVDSKLTSALKQVGAKIVIDHEGISCSHFGVATSGHVLFYDMDGKLKYSGGITPGRGHEGDCQSIFELLEVINNPSETPKIWPVYGCPIIAGKGEQS